jgi:hypothetical protein
MPSGLAPDQNAAQTGLSQVAAAFPHLDRYYGYLASVSWNCRAVWLAKSGDPNAENGSWASIFFTGANWYGTVAPHAFLASPTFTETSWRSQILRAFFDPLEADAMQANCLDRLSRLIDTERALRSGSISDDRRVQASVDLHGVAEWLSSNVAGMRHAYDLFHQMVAAVRQNSNIMDREMREWDAVIASGIFSDQGVRGMSVLAGLTQLLERFAREMVWPAYRADIAWATSVDIATSAAARVSSAEGLALGSALQQLDLDSARREWLVVADIARSLRPAPPVPIDAAGFTAWGNLIEPISEEEKRQLAS